MQSSSYELTVNTYNSMREFRSKNRPLGNPFILLFAKELQNIRRRETEMKCVGDKITQKMELGMEPNRIHSLDEQIQISASGLGSHGS